MRDDTYQNPLVDRYASPEMALLFSPHYKYSCWRRLWIALAEAQQAAGLPIEDSQIEEMKEHAEDIDYRSARELERATRHEIVAHVRAFGKQCPAAKPIIHLGATSSFVTDNTELIQMRRALELILKKIVNTGASLQAFARKTKGIPALAFTHFQPAQPTTVGKRACLWLQDLLFDLRMVEWVLPQILFHGVKGATGTQASFMELFHDDAEKADWMERMVAEKMGFRECFPVVGQTYPRKLDSLVLSALSGIAQSASKFANDLRLLQGIGELEEPFEESQVGSSAMAFKRNPMRSERIVGLSRFLISLAANPAWTAASQWLERSLDDSSNRRIVLPEAFLAADAVLILWNNIARRIRVQEAVIDRHLRKELPFLATEAILMRAVEKGGDRQELHEKIRTLSMNVKKETPEEPERLYRMILLDPAFKLSESELETLAAPESAVGRAPEQVEAFIESFSGPALAKYGDLIGNESEDVEV
jgi:adenylosuccinate lyase